MALERVLCVDDEPHVLEGYRRTLRKQFDIRIANGAEEGLKALDTHGPFAVVVSDYRMPVMNGVRFLAEAAERYPDTFRIMLTGFADAKTAIGAINDGEIFRLLTKPCPSDKLARALAEAVRHHRGIRAERELLEQTLHGSVQVLTETLSLTNPAAFSRAMRMQRVVNRAVEVLGLESPWQYSVAAMLSQLGCVTLPHDLVVKVHSGTEDLSKHERRLFSMHPQTAARLLSKVPRLESIASMIAGQRTAAAIDGSLQAADPVRLGSQLLRVAGDLDQLLNSGLGLENAVERMLTEPANYTQAILRAVADVDLDRADMVLRELAIDELQEGMVLEEDVRATGGLLLMAKGHIVTYAVIERLRCLKSRLPADARYRISVPASQRGAKHNGGIR